MSDMAKTDVGNKQPLHYEVINNSEKKRFEIHIDDKIALEDYEFFTTSAGEKPTSETNLFLCKVLY